MLMPPLIALIFCLAVLLASGGAMLLAMAFAALGALATAAWVVWLVLASVSGKL